MDTIYIQWLLCTKNSERKWHETDPWQIKQDFYKKIKRTRHSQERKILPVSKEASSNCPKGNSLRRRVSKALMVLTFWGTMMSCWNCVSIMVHENCKGSAIFFYSTKLNNLILSYHFKQIEHFHSEDSFLFTPPKPFCSSLLYATSHVT